MSHIHLDEAHIAASILELTVRMRPVRNWDPVNKVLGMVGQFLVQIEVDNILHEVRISLTCAAMLTWIRSFIEFISKSVMVPPLGRNLVSDPHVFSTLYGLWLTIVKQVRDHTLDFPDGHH